MKVPLARVSGRKVAFVDWAHVEAGYCVRPPKKEPWLAPRGVAMEQRSPVVDVAPVLETDCPWEAGFLGSYVSVVQDGDLARLWYEAYPAANARDDSTLLCYAESRDQGRTSCYHFCQAFRVSVA
ncbi:MAG: hypothetical protein Kow0069_20370 [Promethearchaeota archaeon]